MQRARKIERFLSQPFYVAEQFTGTPGEYVPIAETVRGFKEILEGKHDDLPEARVLPQGHDRPGRRGGEEGLRPWRARRSRSRSSPPRARSSTTRSRCSRRARPWARSASSPTTSRCSPCSTRPSCGSTSPRPTSCASRRARATCRWPTTARWSSSRRRHPAGARPRSLRDRLQDKLRRAQDAYDQAEERLRGESVPRQGDRRRVMEALGWQVAAQGVRQPRLYSCSAWHERALAERLITYDTSDRRRLCAPRQDSSRAGSRRARSTCASSDHNGLPVILADVGADATARRVILHGHLDVVPGRAEQFEPRVEGDRLIGRGAYDMKGGLAAMMCARPRRAPRRTRARALPVRARRGVRGRRRPLHRRARGARVRGRLRDHRRADRPAHRGPGQGRAGHAPAGHRPLGARLDAVAGRQRRAQGDRRLPQDRDAAVRARVVGAVRPALDQPRPDHGRRRAQQGARRVRHGRRRPLPARARTPGRSWPRSAAMQDVEVVRTFTRAPAHRLAHATRTCAR